MPAVTVTFKTSFAVLSYSMILADTVRGLLIGAGYGGVSRTAALLGITTTTLLPLCMVKNLSGLAPFSLVGVSGMFYTAFAMAARYLGGSYAIAKPIATVATKGKKVATIAAGGGKYVADVSANLRPTFGNVGASGALSPNVFILVCLLSTAYMAHFNAPKFYVELKNNTLRRYNAVVASSFSGSASCYSRRSGRSDS
jgi:amino acid permease